MAAFELTQQTGVHVYKGVCMPAIDKEFLCHQEWPFEQHSSIGWRRNILKCVRMYLDICLVRFQALSFTTMAADDGDGTMRIRSHVTRSCRWQLGIPSMPFLLSCPGVPAASAAPDATETFPFFCVFRELDSFSLQSIGRFRELCALRPTEPRPLLSPLDSKPCSSSDGWGRALLTLGLRCSFRCCILGLLASPSTPLPLSSRMTAVNTRNKKAGVHTALNSRLV